MAELIDRGVWKVYGQIHDGDQGDFDTLDQCFVAADAEQAIRLAHLQVRDQWPGAHLVIETAELLTRAKARPPVSMDAMDAMVARAHQRALDYDLRMASVEVVRELIKAALDA